MLIRNKLIQFDSCRFIFNNMASVLPNTIYERPHHNLFKSHSNLKSTKFLTPKKIYEIFYFHWMLPHFDRSEKQNDLFLF
jgi:hypothetical protein